MAEWTHDSSCSRWATAASLSVSSSWLCLMRSTLSYFMGLSLITLNEDLPHTIHLRSWFLFGFYWFYSCFTDLWSRKGALSNNCYLIWLCSALFSARYSSPTASRMPLCSYRFNQWIDTRIIHGIEHQAQDLIQFHILLLSLQVAASTSSIPLQHPQTSSGTLTEVKLRKACWHIRSYKLVSCIQNTLQSYAYIHINDANNWYV